MFFIADLIACSTCFGHHYARHQELDIIIQLVSAGGLWCLVFKLSIWCGAEGYVPGLRAAFGHHYAHHQELESIIQLVAACGLWCLVFKLSLWCRAESYVSDLRAAAPKTTGSNQLYNTLELLMMGIMVPETC
jgi:hypothetical protein